MPSDADLTARARIRNAALDLFARQGESGTTIRAVAETAGVSPGLVQHHFGTKAALRESCDGYVAQVLRSEAQHAVDEAMIADVDYLSAAYRSAPLVVRYMARALIDEAGAGDRLFDEIVAITEDHLAAQAADAGIVPQDVRGRAAVFTAMKLGVVVLHRHLSRALGEDSLGPEGMARVGAAVLDVVSADFVGQDMAGMARVTLDRMRSEPLDG